MNTPNVPEKPSLAELSVSIDAHSVVEKALASAQEEIAELKDARREERLGWIVICVVIFDCFVLLNARNSVAPIVIGLIQVAALSVLARRLGVEEFATLFHSVLNRMSDITLGKAKGD